jgi:hypothetical protein
MHGELRNAYRNLIAKPKGKVTSGEPQHRDGRLFKMDLTGNRV